MNFEFIRECRLESDELQAMYDNVLQELEVIRRTLRWKSFCVIRTKMSTT